MIKTTGMIKHKLKEINNRNIVAFDVVMEYLDRNPELKKAKYPINVTMKTKYITYDIIAVKEQEIENLYENINTISQADKVIIIMETNNYIKRNIETKRPCYICTYPPLEIVDSSFVKYEEHIENKFPNGESSKDVEKRLRDFCNYLLENYNRKTVALVAHKAPQLALDVITKNISWEQAIEQDWKKTKNWQPGWIYEIK